MSQQRKYLTSIYKGARGGNHFVKTAQDLSLVIHYCHEVLKWSPDSTNEVALKHWVKIKDKIAQILYDS